MSIPALMKRIRKKTESVNFLESKYGEVQDWISTGCYAFNRILSGSIYKGVPCGRVVLFGGESSSGKSLLAAQIAAEASASLNYDCVFYFDSEGGGHKKFFESRGCDMTKLEHILVENIEDATVKILATYKELVEYKKKFPNAKFLVILDSLGGLVANKLLEDAAKGKQKQDMGARAKKCNNLMKALTIPALKSDTSAIIVNHIYDDPSALYSSKIQNQSGGKGSAYVSCITVQFSYKLEKADVAEAQEEKIINEFLNGDDGDEEETKNKAKTKPEEYYSSSCLNFFTTKNRIVVPFHSADLYVNFKTGLGKYEGLVDVALKYGMLQSGKGFYTVPKLNNEKVSKKDIMNKDKEYIWEAILDDIDKASQEDLSYSSVLEAEQIDNQIEAQIEALYDNVETTEE